MLLAAAAMLYAFLPGIGVAIALAKRSYQNAACCILMLLLPLAALAGQLLRPAAGALHTPALIAALAAAWMLCLALLMHFRTAWAAPLVMPATGLGTLGMAVAVHSGQSAQSPAAALMFGAGCALAMGVFLALMAALRRRLARQSAPAAWQGLPLQVLSLALAALGIHGLWRAWGAP